MFLVILHTYRLLLTKNEENSSDLNHDLITKDPGTCGKTVWTHTILVISSWILECIMEVGRYNVDGMLGADLKEL